MKRLLIVVVVLLVSFASRIQMSAQEHKQGHRIVTRTRLQVLFSGLESKWLQAIQDKDNATLNQLLSDEFEVWTPTPPGEPIPRAEWLERAFNRKLQSFQFRQLAVRAVTPDVSVASFVLTETFQKAGKPQSEEHFIVDLWVKSGAGENWQCTDRYSWNLGEIPQAKEAQPDMKPSGKQ